LGGSCHRARDPWLVSCWQLGIAKTLRLDPKTVGKYAHAATVEDVPTSDGQCDTAIRPYLGYLHRRWNEGCTDAARLCEEIRKMGYQGSSRTVRRQLQPVRATKKPVPEIGETLTVRQATQLLTRRPDSLDEDDTTKLKKLLARCPELEAVAECVRTFVQIMKNKRGAELEDWLVRAEATQMPSLRSLACGGRQDFDAVKAGLTLEWSSGRGEGNVNRIILRIKRDGYGRACFDLLRLQILRSD
jgi:transposase